MKHAAKCMARLVDAILGAGAAAPQKLMWGRELCILGIDVRPATSGFHCRPASDKARSWRRSIELALSSSRLTAGEASKLAGKRCHLRFFDPFQWQFTIGQQDILFQPHQMRVPFTLKRRFPAP